MSESILREKAKELAKTLYSLQEKLKLTIKKVF